MSCDAAAYKSDAVAQALDSVENLDERVKCVDPLARGEEVKGGLRGLKGAGCQSGGCSIAQFLTAAALIASPLFQRQRKRFVIPLAAGCGMVSQVQPILTEIRFQP